MSKTVDQRVVEMRFDNRQFESNVRTSMSTIEKLKQSLNFGKSAKGLEGLSSAAKKVDFSGMGNGIDTVHAKFSALQVIGVTALANITNSAINAGKRITSALTIDPIKTGFQEYETQINAVQTILANTQSKGTTIDQVNAALKELNDYADLTIYNFTEMTRNIGTFTAAGIDLDTSVNAIQGIANLAAVSGSTSQQASVAMYQLSQALAAGTVKLMDWNSVVNAGMGGQIFQDALKETSELLGTGAEAAIQAQGSFRESLQTGWLTSEVLTETLKKFTTSGAIEYVSKYTGLSAEAVQAALDAAEAQYGEADAIEYASKALAEKTGKNAEEIKSVLQFAKTAEDAATKIKTFTQLWDVLKEAAQSGWAQTWQLILGDFEEAKEFFTDISEPLIKMIDRMSDARNKLLGSALGKGFSGLSKKLSSILEPAKKAADTVQKVTTSITDLGGVVDDVILGKFGDGQTRFDALTKSGYNWCEVQNKVNESLGNSFRYTQEQIDAQDKLLGKQKETTKATSETAQETKKLSDSDKERIKQLAKLSDAQLRAKGYTEEQIAAFRELRNTAKQLGIPLNEFIDNLDKINGRWLLLNSIKNVGEAIGKVFSSIGKAWKDIFEPIKPEQLFNAIAAIHKFTSSLILSDENAKKLTRTFKGLFAILDIVSTILGGGVKLAFKALSTVLGMFDMNILDLTAALGDVIVKFHDFLFNNKLINAGFELLAVGIEKAITAVRKMMKAFSELPLVQKFVENFKEAIENIKDIDFSNIGSDLIEGLKNGLSGGIGSVIEILVNIGKEILNAIKGVLGIHSPSTEMYEIGTNVIEGLFNGLRDGIDKVTGILKDIGSKILEVLGKINWSKVFAGGVSVSMLAILMKLANAINKLTSPMEGLGSLFEGVGEVLQQSAKNISKILKGFAKVLNSFAFSIKAKALRNVALSLLMLVGAIALLTFLDIDKLWDSVKIVGALAAILAVLAIATNKMTDASASIGKDGPKIGGLKTGLIAIGVALLMMAATVKIVGSMRPSEATRGFMALTGMVVEMTAFLGVMALLSKIKGIENVDKLGKTMLKMSFSLLIMAGVVKLIGLLSAEDMLKGVAFVGVFTIFVMALTAVSKNTGPDISKVGGMMMKLSIAIGLMVLAVKMIGLLNAEDMIKGVAFISGFTIFVASLVLISKLFPQARIQKVGGLVLSISFSLMLMVGVCKLVGMLKPEDMVKGAAFAAGFLVFVGILVKVTTIASDKKIAKVSATILAMSVAIGILAGVSILLGLINVADLAKGITAVTMLGAIMTAMIWATRGAENVKGNIVAMTVAIGIMVGSVVLLSFIDPSKLAGATAAMVSLMGAFALMTKMAGSMKKSMGSLITMTLVVGALAGLLYLLSNLPIASTLNAAASLSILLLSLSASMHIISKTGPLSKKAMQSMAAMTGVVAGLALILGIMAYFKVEPSIETAVSLSILLLAMAGVTAILSMVKVTAYAAVEGVAALLIVVSAIGAFIGVLGYLNKNFPEMEEFLNSGIPILQAIGEGIGSFVGGIVSGFSGAVLDIIPKLGEALSDFMDEVSGFVEGAGQIDSDVLIGIGYLSMAIIALTAADFLSGISSILQLGSSFSDLGKDLSGFIKYAKPFINGISDLKQDSVEAANTLAQMILTLSKADLISAISSLIGLGDGSFETLGKNLSAFGKAVVAFSNEVAGKINPEAVTAAANAGMLLAELQKSLPKTGGWIQEVAGEQDLAAFGSACEAFGESIAKFSKAVTGDNTIDPAAIEAAATAGTLMSKLQNSLPKTGGWIQEVAGEQDLAAFGLSCAAFGKAIAAFSKSVSGEGAVDPAAAEQAANAGTIMSKLQNSLPKSGGWIQDIAGEQDLAKFGASCKAFGEAISEFSNNVNIDEKGVTTATNAGKMMVKLQKAIPDDKWFDGKVQLDEFGKKIKKFGQGLAGYGEEVADINTESITTSITQAKRLASLAKSVVDLELDDIGKFKDITKIGKAIKDYSDKVADINPENVTVSVTAANKLKNLIIGLAGIDTSGISLFNIGSIGDKIKSYSDKVAEINPSQIAVSIVSVRNLMSLINGMAGMDSSGVGGFVQALNTLGTASIDGFVNAFATAGPRVSAAVMCMMTSLNAVIISQGARVAAAFNVMMTSAVTAITSRRSLFVTAGSSLMVGFRAGLMSGSASVVPTMTMMVTRMITVVIGRRGMFMTAGLQLMVGFRTGIMSGSTGVIAALTMLTTRAYVMILSRRGQFMMAGMQLMLGLSSGIRAGSSGIVSSISRVVASCVSGIRIHYFSFFSAGLYLGQGLTAGIAAQETAAYNAGFRLGKAAVEGEKAGQKSQSPSKATKQAGKWLGEGLIIGMDQMGRAVYRSGEAMGANAVDSISGALSTIQNISDDDTSFLPTIRPVVDMADLQSGSRTLQIGADLSARLLTKPVNSLEQIVSDAQAQVNASNNEVIQAINGLREDLNQYYAMDDPEIALYVDSKKLASSIAKPMNRQLNILSKRGAY